MSAPTSLPAVTGDSRRTATAAEARALGHPTRLRIVFACRDEALTNKELAERLGVNPGTVHHHVRPLLEHGFLRRETARRGARGAREQPYRATGKSWRLSLETEVAGALRQVGGQELLGAEERDVIALTRLGLTMTPSERDSLLARLHTVLAEVVDSASAAGTGDPHADRATTATRDPHADRATAGRSDLQRDRAPSSDSQPDEPEPITLLLAVTRQRGGP